MSAERVQDPKETNYMVTSCGRRSGGFVYEKVDFA